MNSPLVASSPYSHTFLRSPFKHPAQNFVILTVLFIALGGLCNFASYNYLPATPLLEALFLLLSLSAVRHAKIAAPLSHLSLAALAYFVGSFVYAVLFRSVNVLDFIQAYKAFYYTFLLSFFVGTNLFDTKRIARLLNILLAFFLFKYTVSFVFSIFDRPGIFTENNYELIFLLLLFVSYQSLFSKFPWPQVLALFLVFVFSGSRSSMVALLFTLSVMSASRTSIRSAITTLAFLPVLAFSTYRVFLLRSGGAIDIETIDRFRFFMIFLDEVRTWRWWQFLVGAPRITALSDAACNRLSYFQDLFSYKHDGSCYSVALHSYILRAIFDHGLLGLLFIFAFVYVSLRAKGYAPHVRVNVIGILFITGLSVSSINNVYAALPLAIMFSAFAGNTPQHARTQAMSTP